MLLALDDSGREKQKLRQSLKIGNRFHLRCCNWGCNRRKRRHSRVIEIARQARHLESGINLEQERFVLPIERVRRHAKAVVRMLGPAVVLPCGIEIEILAQDFAEKKFSGKRWLVVQ